MALYRNIAGFERLGLFVEQNTTNDFTSGSLTIAPRIPADEIAIDPGYVPVSAIDPVTQLPPSYNSTTAATPPVATATTTPNVAIVPPPTTQEIDYWPLITLAGLYITMINGEPLFKDTRKLVFIGGLGALYYTFYKKSGSVTPNP